MSAGTRARLSVNINSETRAALVKLADRESTTVTETVRRSVSVYKFIKDQLLDPDIEIAFRNKQTGESQIVTWEARS